MAVGQFSSSSAQGALLGSDIETLQL